MLQFFFSESAALLISPDLRDFLNQIAEELNIPQSKRNESVERWKFAFEERDIYNTHQLQRLLEKGGRLPFVIDDKTARKIHSALNIQSMNSILATASLETN